MEHAWLYINDAVIF